MHSHLNPIMLGLLAITFTISHVAPGDPARLAAGPGLDRWVEVWEKINQSVARAEALNTDRKLVILNAFSMLESIAGERVGA